MVIAACGASGTGTWTYDPNIGLATGPAAASGASAGASEAPPSTAASVPAESAAASGPSASGSAGGITLTAKNVAFDQKDLAAPAGAPFAIQFDNEDAGVQHNVAIYSDSSAANNLFRGTIVTGPTQTSYSVPALPAGSYYFQCDVHPSQMNGTIVIH
jgi:plastocyanin